MRNKTIYPRTLATALALIVDLKFRIERLEAEKQALERENTLLSLGVRK